MQRLNFLCPKTKTLQQTGHARKSTKAAYFKRQLKTMFNNKCIYGSYLD